MSLDWEHALFLVPALLASALILGIGRRSGRAATGVLLAVLLPALVAWIGWAPPTPSSAELEAPRKVEDRGYVSSDTCRACHPSQYASWHESFHRTMTQVASPETIAAPQESFSLWANGRAFDVDFEDGVMWAKDVDPLATQNRLRSTARTLPGPSPVSFAPRSFPPDFPRTRGQVMMTTGSHHMQLYWLRFPGGAISHLTWAWLIRDQRWVPGEAVYLQPPRGVMGLSGRWDTNCIKCHSVAGQPGIVMREGSGLSSDARAGELGIACEACHGPAREHVLANRNPVRRYAAYSSDEDDPTIVHPNKLSTARSSQICGRCHSGHEHTAWDPETGTPFRAGDPLEEYFRLRRFDTQPVDRRSGYFWQDGTARVTGREYSAMIESGCYTRGDIACSSCHSMHESDPNDQLAEGRDGDDACLQCHDSFADRIEEHTHHPASSSGSRCYNCHMPNTTYGLLSVTRSHRIDSPSVEMSTRAGRPNACNLCHVDQTLEWANDRLASWFGHEEVALGPDERDVPAAALWMLKGDAVQRATAAWHFGWDPVLESSGKGWQTSLLALGLEDPYAAVRYLSERSLRKFPAYDALDYDFVEPPEAQARAVAAARAISRRAHEDPNPQLAEALINRLRSERDDTPISIQE